MLNSGESVNQTLLKYKDSKTVYTYKLLETNSNWKLSSGDLLTF